MSCPSYKGEVLRLLRGESAESVDFWPSRNVDFERSIEKGIKAQMPRFLSQTKEFKVMNPSERVGTSSLHRNSSLLVCTGSNTFGPSLNKSLDTMTWPVICVCAYS